MDGKSRIISVAVLIALLLSACSGKTAIATEQSSVTTVETETMAPEWYSRLGERSFNNKTIRVLSRSQPTWPQAILEMGSNEETGEVLNDALIARNRMVEEQFSLVLETEYLTSVDTTVKNAVLADDDIIDIAFLALQSGASFQKEQYLSDLKQSTSIDPVSSYWDQNAVKELDFGGHLYLMCGDLTPMTGQGTWAMFFSKDLIEDNHLDNPYELVAANKWTYDVFYSMLSKVKNDLNGDGVMDTKDQYGLLTQVGDVQMFTLAFGENYTKSGDNGRPVLALGSSSRSFDVMDTIAKVFADESNLVSNDTVNVQQPCFYEGRAMFWVSGILRLFNLRDIDLDFGLIPLPKYDAEQSDYHHTVKENWGSCVCIPKTAKFDDASFVLEAIAAASYETVRPAYFTTTLGAKLMRDERSYEMLDIILSTRNFDAMTLYKWGGLIASLNTAISNNAGDYASLIESKKEAVSSEIANMFSSIND